MQTIITSQHQLIKIKFNLQQLELTYATGAIHITEYDSSESLFTDIFPIPIFLFGIQSFEFFQRRF